MRLPWLLGVIGVTTGSLLMTAVPSAASVPTHGVRIRSLHLDGKPLAAPAAAEVSPRPRLVVEIDRPVDVSGWEISLDGSALPGASPDATLRRLDAFLPGPLPMGSSHLLRLNAGSLRLTAPFSVVPPLAATIAIGLRDLHADQPLTAVATIHFARPVADRAAAAGHIEMTGHPGLKWKDQQTVELTASGFHPGDRLQASVAAGVKAADGSYSTAPQSASLKLPSSITSVIPGRMVQMYYVNTPEGQAALMAHRNQIDVLSPGWYDANADGSITGYAHQDVIDAAHASGIAIIPLVVNTNVDPDVGHAIIADPVRRATLARNLVSEAKTYGYAGFQLDFEQIRSSDRDLLTALVSDCAAAFHAAGLNLSIAVIPRLPEDDTASGQQSDYVRTWSGAYDFSALAKSADFLSFMTYDEHNGVTPPGAVSGTPWMRRALEYSLRGVPPEKATMGLPTYYHDWTGVGQLTSSSYADAMTLAQSNGAAPVIDPVEEEMHFGYDAYGRHHELWIQSTDTLRLKLPLLYEYSLKGISVWRLGFEDPSFWTLIPPRH